MDERIVGYRVEPPPRPAMYPVVWPMAGQAIDATLLCDSIVTVPTHWTFDAASGRSRTVLCTGPLACERCSPKRRPVPTGYAAAYEHRGQRRVAIVIPYRGIVTLLSLVPMDRPLVGVRVLIRRTYPHPQSPLACQLVMRDDDRVPLRPLPDLTATLEALYGPGCLSGGWRESDEGGGP